MTQEVPLAMLIDPRIDARLNRAALDAKTLSLWPSKKSLTKHASLNALAAAIEYGARMVMGFVIQPLLVAGLGNYLYGAWQVLIRLTGYMAAATGRSPQALKWTIAHRKTSTDYEQKRRFVGSTVVVWLLFFPPLAGLGGVVAWFAPSWLGSPTELTWGIRLATGLLAVNLILISLVDIPRSVLCGENLEYKRMWYSAILVFTGGGLIALALYWEAGLVGVAAAMLATTLLTGMVFLRLVRAWVPWFGISRPSWVEVRRFFGLSGWFMAWVLINRIMKGGDIVVLGLCGSAEMVTTFTLTKYTPEALIHLVAIVVFSISPGLGSIIGAGDLQKAARIRAELMALTWLLTTVAGTTILLWNGAFVGLWVGAEHYAGSAPTLLITLMILQFVLIRNDSNVIDLTLNLRNKVLLGAFSVTISMVLAAVLVGAYQLGLVGLCLGFIAGRTILSLSYPWLVSRCLGISLRRQFDRVLRPATITVLLFALALSVDGSLNVATWVGLFAAIGLTLTVVTALAFYAGLTVAMRQCLLQRARLLTRFDEPK